MSEGSVGYYDSSSVLTELSAGSVNEVLTMGASAPQWSASSGVALTRTSASANSAQSTSSLSYVDATGMTSTMGAGTGHAIATYTTTCQSTNDFALTCEWSTDGNIPTSPTFDSTGGSGKVVTITSISDTLGSQVSKFMIKLTSSGSLIVCRNNTDAYAQWLQIA